METEQTAVQLKEIPEQYAPQYAVVQACLDAGLKQADIARGIGKSRATITYAKNQLERKYDLTSRNYVKLAANAVKTTLQGKPIGDADAPKASTIIETAKMVYDRYQPVKQAETVNNTNTFVQFNLGAASAPEVIDIPDIIDITPPGNTP